MTSAGGSPPAKASSGGHPGTREPLERASGWAGRRERGAYFMMRATLFGLRLLGRPVMLPIVHLVVLYFFLFSRGSREASLDYLRRVQAAAPESGLTPTWRHAYRHFREFATAILDKIDTWFCPSKSAAKWRGSPTNLAASWPSAPTSVTSKSCVGWARLARA
jgi:hypothetical protein